MVTPWIASNTHWWATRTISTSGPSMPSMAPLQSPTWQLAPWRQQPGSCNGRIADVFPCGSCDGCGWLTRMLSCTRPLHRRWTGAETNFGQTDFGHPCLTDFGPNLGGRLLPKLVFQSFCLFSKKKQKVKMNKCTEEQTPFGAPKGAAQKRRAPKPRKILPRRWGAQNFALFSLSRHHFALFVSLWVSSR